MAKHPLVEEAYRLCSKEIEAIGYDLIDISFGPENGVNTLCFFVDKRGGISFDDCERVTACVDTILDTSFSYDKPYNLSVSSPGLDRPLTTPSDFLRYVDTEIEISLYQPFEGLSKASSEILEKGLNPQGKKLTNKEKKFWTALGRSKKFKALLVGYNQDDENNPALKLLVENLIDLEIPCDLLAQVKRSFEF